MQIAAPYLIFLGEVPEALDAKTGLGIAYWRPDLCLAQWRLPECAADAGLPDMNAEEAAAKGAKTMVIGIAPFGGALKPSWIKAILQSLAAGMDIASGMHSRLRDIPEIREAAERHGRTLFDVRHADRKFDVGTGRKRTGKRLLTVGSDCAVGKKYTALSIFKELQSRGVKADFRATGQTGVLIAGRGVAIDAVVADFIAGAAEWLSPDNDPDHWDLIEGQGSLFHPAYAGVSLGLLHGSQPDALVLCHDPQRPHIDGYPNYPVPELRRCIEANEQAARLTNPNAHCIGIALNTSQLTAERRTAVLREYEDRYGLPCFDPIATGAGVLAAKLPA